MEIKSVFELHRIYANIYTYTSAFTHACRSIRVRVPSELYRLPSGKKAIVRQRLICENNLHEKNVIRESFGKFIKNESNF